MLQDRSTLTDSEARLISKSRVLGGIRDYDRERSGDRDLRAMGAEDIAQGPVRRRVPLSPDAANLLRIAWQTELAARVGAQFDDDALRIATLPTLPVQAYYAVFNAGRAFTHVSGAPKDKHAALQEAFAREHSRSAPGALQVKLVGDPGEPSLCELDPPICVPSGFNPLEDRQDPADFVWAALRTARRRRLEDARDRWLADRKNKTTKGERYKRLPPGQLARLAAEERPTTLLDYLYMLRCSTNYRRIDEYSADVEPQHISRLYLGLLHLMDMGLLCYEGQIARYVGVDQLRTAHADWAQRVQAVGPWATEASEARIAALGAVIR